MGTTNTTNALRISLTWAWAGPAAGLACMIALFIAGIVTQTPGLTVMAASIAAMLGSVWAVVHTTLQRKLARAEQS